MTEEEQSLHKKLYKRFLKALASHSMIADGDKILIGLSGGKDSLCLLEFLAERMHVTHPHFTVEAIHIRMGNVDYKSDTNRNAMRRLFEQIETANPEARSSLWHALEKEGKLIN